MSLTNEERKTLVALEMKKARETYEDNWYSHCSQSLEWCCQSYVLRCISCSLRSAD